MVAPDQSIAILLAHSAGKTDLAGDPYARHIDSVRLGASARVEDMLRYARVPPPGLAEAVHAAATFHDLGKLDPENQKALRQGRRGRLMWDHIDAGVAYLAAGKNWMAGWLVRAHHRPGLPCYLGHFTELSDRRLRGRRRDDEPRATHDRQIERTNAFIGQYTAAHDGVVGPYPVIPQKPRHGLTMRLALSCLVDADHSDSAFFETGHQRLPPLDPRWAERLVALSEFVRSLPTGNTKAERERNRRRREFFEACLQSELAHPMVACEGPVGIGKTTAVAAYLIRRARDEKLRRLIIIAPFTNILTQTAERLRRALVLPGEEADRVIVEHHHRADFPHRDDRGLAVLWDAPVVLTTAVAFFETLASCDPASLRKLHAVPGSAIFVDEAHAALPTRLWRQNWRWLKELAEDWGCRIVLASGSLARFWNEQDIVGDSVELPELMPKRQSDEVIQQERQRIRYTQAVGGRVLDVGGLIGLIAQNPGPRLVILNTVQSAAVVAKRMRDSGHNVLHLSTALAPKDRKVVLLRVEKRLSSTHNGTSDWTLVATSCVEAGVDLSFRCAFRERFAAASTIQVGGRVNRHGEYHERCTVYDFALADCDITQHPAACVAAAVLHEFMNRDVLNTSSPADVVTLAMREELMRHGGLRGDPLSEAETERDYPEVQKMGRIIDTATCFVVVDPELRQKLESRVRVGWRLLLEGSVQLWSRRIGKLGLRPLAGHQDVYGWDYHYDPCFLGYMSGVLGSRELTESDSAWII